MEERAARLHTLSVNHASANQNDSTLEQEQQKTYVIDTNVLIHDPNSLLNFEEHRVVIPMTVLEELDKLKSGKSHTGAGQCPPGRGGSGYPHPPGAGDGHSGHADGADVQAGQRQGATA